MSPVRGILLKICALALFTIMASLIKASVAHVPAGQAVFFRAFCSMPVVLAWLAIRGELATGLRTRHPMMHVKRGLIGGSAMGLTFVALGRLPLPEVTVLGFIAPILVLVLSVIFLKETVRLFRWSMVALGLVGVLIVVWPRLTLTGMEADSVAAIGVAAALVAASLRAIVQVHIRQMVKTETTSAIAFHFVITVSAGGLLTLPFGWVMPEPTILIYLISAGLVGGVAQLFITSSFRYADVSVLAPFDYVSILFSMVAGFFFFAEIPTMTMLLGASLVILSGVLIIWREHRLGVRKRAQEPVSAQT